MTKAKARKLLIISFVCTGFMIGLGLLVALSPHFRTQVVGGSGQTLLAHVHKAPKEPFPEIDTTNLNPIQLQIIRLSKQEYAKRPVSFDKNVIKYTQGSKESWCADYISWVMMKAGQPLRNPNSASWRIPGTATMQEYYNSQQLYIRAGAYKPAIGDVAIYRNKRSHVNFVIAVNDNTMTTIGGNEIGHLRINTQKYSYGTEGLSGFGRLLSVHGVRQ